MRSRCLCPQWRDTVKPELFSRRDDERKVIAERVRPEACWRLSGNSQVGAWSVELRCRADRDAHFVERDSMDIGAPGDDSTGVVNAASAAAEISALADELGLTT